MTTVKSCLAMEEATKPPPPPEDDNKLLKIKRLKAKLINEEHRLVLMKKIRQSQSRPVNQQQQQLHNQQQQQQNHLASLNSTPSNLSNSSHAASNPAKKLRPTILSGSGIANSLIAAARNQQAANNSNNLLQGTSSMNQTPAHAHQRPKNSTLWNPPPQQTRHPTPAGIAPPHVGSLSRQPITTPPNVVQAMMGSLNAGQQSLLLNQRNATTAAVGTPNSSRRSHGVSQSRQPITTPPNVVQTMMSSLNAGQQSLLLSQKNAAMAAAASTNSSRRSHGGAGQSRQPLSTQSNVVQEMLLQKRTAAKGAIQKQLEQTLMQLPQKHIQLAIDFLPNANNIEFIYYVGLEACVDYLTNTKNPLDKQPLEKPSECSTCGTDFTPSWSWKRSQAVCENCVGNHVKKSIKNNQSNRIKSVLAKASKQEQEMDQRIIAEAASVASSTSSPVTSHTNTNQRHSSLLQPASHSQRSSSQSQNWQRANQASHATINRSSPATTTTSSAAANVQPRLNMNNPLAALQPAALASLLQMNPQLSTLASLMTANAAPPQVSQANSNPNQIAQMAALLMNQLTMNFWNKR